MIYVELVSEKDKLAGKLISPIIGTLHRNNGNRAGKTSAFRSQRTVIIDSTYIEILIIDKKKSVASGLIRYCG